MRATDFQATQNAWRAWSVMSSGLLRWVFRRTGYEVCCASTTGQRAHKMCVVVPHRTWPSSNARCTRESRRRPITCAQGLSAPPHLRAVSVEADAALPGHLSLQKRPTPLVCGGRNTAIPIAQPPIAYRATPNARATCTYSFMAPPPVQKKRDITCVRRAILSCAASLPRASGRPQQHRRALAT